VTWLPRDVTGLIDPHFPRILVDPSDPLTAYAVRDRFGGGHVFRTTNGGLLWTDISGNLADLPVNVIVADRRTVPATLYVGTDDGVYRSTNLGVLWARYGAGLPNAQVAELRLNPNLNTLAVATHGRGMWQILTPGATPTRPTRPGTPSR
jgi:photosystem II stability/assembly factor-like uncharacterized protein